MGCTLKQIWTICGALLNIVSCGFHLGFPTILLRDAKEPGSDLQLSLETESWIVSAVAITALPSFILTAPVLQIFGRKYAHFCCVTPGLLSCLVLYFARDITTLIIARLISGLTIGSSMFVTAVIIGEYSSPEYRGVFLNGKAVSATLGILMVHAVGMFFDWRITALHGLIPSLLSFVITFTWPESPSWLAYKGRFGDCEESFSLLRGHSDKAKKELMLLIQTQRYRRHSKNKDSSILNKLKQNLAEFSQSDFQKPTLIVFFVFVILETCGRHSFPAYAIKFMSAFTENKASTFYYVLGVDIIIFLASVGSCGLVKLCRRRTLLFVSGGTSCVLLTLTCVYLYLQSQGLTPSGNVWLPLLLLCLYFIILNLGTAPTAMSLLGEIYPIEHRGLGTIISGVFYSLSLLVTLKVTPALINTIDVHGTFFAYMVCMAGSLVYLYLFLPETEGKTLQEIENHFNGVTLKLDQQSESMDMKLLDIKNKDVPTSKCLTQSDVT